MIRFRQKGTGAEAEWDRGQWSGDPDLVRLLEVASRVEFPPNLTIPHATFWSQQQLMAEHLPGYGVVVVRQTTPVEDPHDPYVVY